MSEIDKTPAEKDPRCAYYDSDDCWVDGTPDYCCTGVETCPNARLKPAAMKEEWKAFGVEVRLAEGHVVARCQNARQAEFLIEIHNRLVNENKQLREALKDSEL